MKNAFIAVVCLLVSAPSHGREGAIVKVGGGEQLINGISMLLSPKSGSESGILAEQTFAPGGETVLHAHDQGDEFFYVVSGRGHARLGERIEEIGPGDALLVSAGQAHKLSNPFNEDLVVVFFMATPELAEQFRAIHARQLAEPDRPITAEEHEKFTRRFGGGRTIHE